MTPQGRALLVDLQPARVQALVDQLSRPPESEQDTLSAAVDALNALRGAPRHDIYPDLRYLTRYPGRATVVRRSST
jgi:hypothetical protein